VNINRLTIASEETLIYNIKLKFGRFTALLTILDLMLSVIGSVIGVTAIATDILTE